MIFKEMIEKYKDIIFYLFFGVCTTLINVITYWVMTHFIGIKVMPSTIVAWILAVLFAYVTNRKWVFQSKLTKMKEIINEMISFFGCRLATGVVDWLLMFIFVDLLALNGVVIKFGSNVLVIVLNYIASKLIIFRKEKEK